jgi:hypothetical protein
MNNISITKSNNKFNKNIIINKDVKFLEIDISQINIYKYHYAYNEQNTLYIINTSLMSNEILSFIEEFHKSINFIIYHDIFDKTLFERLQSIATKHIVNYDIDQIGTIKLPKHMLNDNIYTNLAIDNNKTNQIVFFLDNKESIPIFLQSQLYPNSKLPIRMFNNPKIEHPQNLGFCDEVQKKDILLQSQILCYIEEEYLAEAMVCGCKVLDINDSFDMDKVYIPNVEYTTYTQFLRNNIL